MLLTFIASVIAKKGVAIIADSLVTAQQPVMELKAFIDYVKAKTQDGKEGKLAPTEIINLFQSRTSHTKDYEEKLFKYDNFTAITTAGGAEINGKRIEKIVSEAISALKPQTAGGTIEIKVERLKQFIEKEATEHVDSSGLIVPTIFVITNYNKTTNETTIHKLVVQRTTKDDIVKKEHVLCSHSKHYAYQKVVCDGQSRVSERILYGELPFLNQCTPKIIVKTARFFGVSEKSITAKKIQELSAKLTIDPDIVTKEIRDDFKLGKLTDLSLQQAVDLAHLLLKLEMDIQKYTENIPTVGGVIKLAVIDKSGFKFIAGNEIVKPNSN